MRMNTIGPGEGSRPSRRRVGRGSGSGLGKTCGRGVKGQKSRAGGFHKVGFEGGQMPLQRRLPKVGFASRKQPFNDEVRLDQLEAMSADVVDRDALHAAGLIARRAERIKVIASGELKRAVTVRGIKATKGARAAIEAAGGKVED